MTDCDGFVIEGEDRTGIFEIAYTSDEDVAKRFVVETFATERNLLAVQVRSGIRIIFRLERAR